MDDFRELAGKTLVKFDAAIGGDTIEIEDSDGVRYRMYHSQDCCEQVWLEDIVGDIADLIGSPILLAEVSCSYEHPADLDAEDEPAHDDSFTWTFYRLATVLGSVDLRWFGTSNGYYSESVDFVRIGAN